MLQLQIQSLGNFSFISFRIHIDSFADTFAIYSINFKILLLQKITQTNTVL